MRNWNGRAKTCTLSGAYGNPDLLQLTWISVKKESYDTKKEKIEIFSFFSYFIFKVSDLFIALVIRSAKARYDSEIYH
jgi:hypothetical protein